MLVCLGSFLESTINIQKPGYEFPDEPVIIGGLAM
jgi:hypothetical protein